MLSPLATPRQADEWEATQAARQYYADWLACYTRFALLVAGTVLFLLLGTALAKHPPAAPAAPEPGTFATTKHGTGGLMPWYND